ncbi:MAG TPA: type 4a pilus biogenesis protein PilO [Candidatus Dormibacteraeota bacterium]|jgi:Tfp pilus assembly protein PilO|nr:type 4a pilus biogenesis protein PilO [Candidatus Dormibacteraeota bacterium]
MANPFRDMSVIMQGLVAAAIAVILVLVGIYLPFSPVAQERDQVDKAVKERAQLNQEVQQLSVYKQRYGELKQQMDALNKQLDTLKTIVPEDKETDEFIRLLQGAASASNVDLRRLKALTVASKENNYFEMPFEVQADGPYFNILDFFGRLSRLSRIINVGDLQFNDPDTSKATKYVMKPGSTVVGVFTATTYFTKPADSAPATPAKPAGKP